MEESEKRMKMEARREQVRKSLETAVKGAVEMRGKDGRGGEGDEERESGEEGSKKGGKAEVEEKKVMQKEAMGRVPGVVLKEIRGKRWGKVAVAKVGEVA